MADPAYWAEVLRAFRSHLWRQFTDALDLGMAALGPWGHLTWEIAIYLGILAIGAFLTMLVSTLGGELIGRVEDRWSRRPPSPPAAG